MSAQGLSMKKVKEILRLKYDAKLSHRQIGKSLNISASTVSRCANSAKAHGISWPLPETIDEAALERLIHGESNDLTLDLSPPDFAYLYTEYQKHKHVTKQLLWEEYKAVHGKAAYSYSQFCNLFRDWLNKRKITMRQTHKAGEKMFVDYAGQTIPIYSQHNTEVHEAQIFIAVLGASNYTYAEATLTQSLPDWTSSHVNAFNYFGGTTEVVVPDNLKAGVSKACKYDPDINPTYHQLACHYNIAIVPTRTYSPKDKAKVETGVKIVEQWILARLRNHKFFSLEELNKRIKKLLKDLNTKPFQKLPDNRQTAFIKIDKPALKPLPSQKYIYTEILMATVGIDYHVGIEGHYYSAPYTLTKRKVEVHVQNNCISIYHKGERVAIHAKALEKGCHTTKTEHMPEAHKYFSQWSPEKFITKASTLGANVVNIIKHILNERRHLEQSYRSCLGILNLVKDYDANRLDNACKRALEIGAPRRKNVQLILRNSMDRIESNNATTTFVTTSHENIRGSQYYQ